MYSDKTLSLALAISAGFWGLYWFPLRAIEATGIAGSWSVVFFNACPLLLLCPLVAIKAKQLMQFFWPTVFAALMIGLAFTLYATGLVETTIARATLLYYLTPVWATIIGVVWLSEHLTIARIVAIVVAFIGMYLLLADSGSQSLSINFGDVCSILSGVFWAIGVAALNRWSGIPILPLTTFIFLSTTVISSLFAQYFHSDPLPNLLQLQDAFATAAFWSICILLPCFCIIFRVSQMLYPGRVGILGMSEVVVAILSAAILVPEETMLPLQWAGAAAIVVAGLIEVLFGYTQSQNQSAASDSANAATELPAASHTDNRQ
jgi:drug/metabolite transporter (DMT)-like permease